MRYIEFGFQLFSSAKIIMRIITINKSIDWSSAFSGFDLPIEIYDLYKSSKEKIISALKICHDILIFDVDHNYKESLKIRDRLIKINPALKTIIFTSEINRKYRSFIAFKDIDLFLFSEYDFDLLMTVVRRIYIRKTRAA